MSANESNDESLVERDEVPFPKSDLIDSEPHYSNFTAIQNNLRKQSNDVTHQRSHSSDDRHRAVRVQVDSSSVRHAHSSEQLNAISEYSTHTYTIPINIESKKKDGYIFNLTQIVEDIGCRIDTPYIRSSTDSNSKNVSALLNIVLKMGGTRGPLVNVWRSRLTEEDFQKWYIEKCSERSASLLQYGTNKETSQNQQARDYQTDLLIGNKTIPTNHMPDKLHYENEIQKMYGYDDDTDADATTASSISSRSSIAEPNPYSQQQQHQYRSSSITSILKKPNTNPDNTNRNLSTKNHVKIVAHQLSDDSEHTGSLHEVLPDKEEVISAYQQYQNIPSTHRHYENRPSAHEQYENLQSVQQQYENIQSTQQYYENIPSNYQHYDNTQSSYQQYENLPSPYQQVPPMPSSPYESVQAIHSQSHIKMENDDNSDSNNRLLSKYQQILPLSPSPYLPMQQIHTQSQSHINIENNSNSTINNNNPILSEYREVLHTHPDVHIDPNPEIVSQANPQRPITYEQNISLRYLVPPTPPPPGPLIIREILPPREPTPPPLVVKVQEPSPPTPPPLVLREAPPIPPPHQETTVVTKILSPEPPPARRVIVERSPPLPPKPQSIIIEKWLPYKPVPPREVIIERITQKAPMTEFEPGAPCYERQRRHSAEYHFHSERIPIPVSIQRQKSVDHLASEQISQQPPGTFDQAVWSTHQQILEMQQRGREQLQASQQWAAQQWQQHANNNMLLQYSTHLTTPTLVVYHPPVTTNITEYVQTQEYREQRLLYSPTYIYPYQ